MFNVLLCDFVTFFNQQYYRKTVGYLLVNFIKHNQNYYLKLDVSTSIRGYRYES